MKKIVLAITGSVAAFKGLKLYEALKKKYHVELVLTKGALHFLENLPAEINTEIFPHDYYSKNNPSEHIRIAKDSNLFICYPATHNFIAQIANGFTDSLASLVYSATDAYKIVFPTMNTVMYNSPANLRNLETLARDGVEVLPAKYGLLACKIYGIGRAWEWEDVLAHVEEYFSFQDQFQNRKVLLNFGRTRTYLDGIRYITNNSSGKMGDALAHVLQWAKADLTVVQGDVDIPINYPTTKVITNQEMLQAMLKNYAEQDIVIACAALNDYQIAQPLTGKISKKDHPELEVKLTTNVDVLKELGAQKTRQFLVGFSVQNNFDLEYAKEKLVHKNLDLIVINEISAMNSEENKIILLSKTRALPVDNSSKLAIAKAIINEILFLQQKEQ
ncbi:hypothetical protein P344_04490 [Spiroplasma mirum ATCC 29335]|uniref:Coenzyme A biosynthesis bifunctional protein CoaBC n=1 Tax=Spiroplasma mirum ATCC 29335 TaxID=838561 RepID=W0GRI5_9MOLU|nr:MULTISPECIES: bifunctional phosphopantothenoylcysteine decarboxylase/phosphopantothenate--cysteine ligase CoaBC [Spiroplasma]AHF61156.1 bifunctional phosphopantothenoylcysteine decarboxylase/phosphopantothenate synthase [Spiroplasma mirum ATCC 29335]AHI58220.1 hypothetical protein P344_04490 [Spiroplasma mirum ATCC 29335]AKM53257.1 pantothenate metabolism flavoprotein [Spiroplasma atrichopogonis]